MTGGWGGTESWVRNLEMRLYDYPRAGQRGFHRVRQMTEEDWAPAGGQQLCLRSAKSLCSLKIAKLPAPGDHLVHWLSSLNLSFPSVTKVD